MLNVLRSDTETPSPHRERGRHLLPSLAVALVFGVWMSLAIGPTGVSLAALPKALASLLGFQTGLSPQESLVLFDIRLPRTVLAVFVGAALSVAGAIMQGMFRNPLADPGLIGVSSGAALAAVSVIAFADLYAPAFRAALGVHALPVSAFVGGLATTGLLVAITSRRQNVSTAALLLAGVALAALTQAMMGVVAFLSDDRALRDLTLWNMGSLAGASWSKVIGILPAAIILALILPRLIRDLNGLLLGEAEAFHLGVNVPRAKLVIVLATAIAVGAAVAVAGIVGFIGIVTPHVVRLVAGADHRTLLPASALLGATLVLIADVAARMIVAPAELPLGIVTAILGAPVFLHLVLRRGAHV